MKQPETLPINPSAPKAVGLHGVVRRMLLAATWQYRHRVFKNCVLKATWGDIKIALAGVCIGILAPLIIVLSLPCRTIMWAISPLILPLVHQDESLWLKVAAIVATKQQPPNDKIQP
jgi:hypothetical protein